MRNKLGQATVFLALVLVIVGAAVTFGVSFLTNNNKIANNSRAATCDSEIPNPDQAICFCKKGGVIVFATSAARKANCMSAEPSSYGGSYGATSWGYCDPSDPSGTYTGECSGGGGDTGGDTGGNNGSPAPSNCTTPSLTCLAAGVGTDTTTQFSEDKNNIYYQGTKCKGTKIGAIADLIKTCSNLVTGDCSSVSCVNLFGPSNPDVDFGSKNVYTKSGTPGTYYRAGCQQTVDPVVECFPKVPTGTPIPTATPLPTSAAGSIPGGTSYNGPSYKYNGTTYLNCLPSFDTMGFFGGLTPQDPTNYIKNCVSYFGSSAPLIYDGEFYHCCKEIKQ